MTFVPGTEFHLSKIPAYPVPAYPESTVHAYCLQDAILGGDCKPASSPLHVSASSSLIREQRSHRTDRQTRAAVRGYLSHCRCSLRVVADAACVTHGAVVVATAVVAVAVAVVVICVVAAIAVAVVTFNATIVATVAAIVVAAAVVVVALSSFSPRPISRLHWGMGHKLRTAHAPLALFFSELNSGVLREDCARTKLTAAAVDARRGRRLEFGQTFMSN